MRDWNVVITVAHDHFREACDALQPLGPVKRTRYFNTLVMKVDDLPAFLETFRDWQRTYADVAETVARVAPVTHKFEFQSPEEFQARAKQGVLQFVSQLAGKRFHVRVHRHGSEAVITSMAAERLLGSTLCESLEQAGTPGRVDFADPDSILDVETIDTEAGLALWTREQRARYPFLKLD